MQAANQNREAIVCAARFLSFFIKEITLLFSKFKSWLKNSENNKQFVNSSSPEQEEETYVSPRAKTLLLYQARQN